VTAKSSEQVTPLKKNRPVLLSGGGCGNLRTIEVQLSKLKNWPSFAVALLVP